MKYRALMSAAALICSSLTPLIATAANAEDLDLTPSTITAGAITTQCNLYAGSLSGGTFTAESEITAQDSVFGTEITGTRVIDESTRAAAPGATPTYSDIDASAATHLVRNGKSPNIFATDALANTVTWSNSTYTYTAMFNIVTTYNYTCHITENIPASAAVYEDENTCVARAKTGDMPDDYPQGPGEWCNVQEPAHSGNYVNRLVLQPAVDAHPEERPELDASYTVLESGTAEKNGFEANGGPWTDTSASQQVQAVVCISPGSKAGSWRAQNNYGGLGGQCSTATFNSLPPHTIIPSASLPVV